MCKRVIILMFILCGSCFPKIVFAHSIHLKNNKSALIERGIVINNLNTANEHEMEELKILRTSLEKCNTDKDIYWKNGQIDLLRELLFKGYTIVRHSNHNNESIGLLLESEDLNKKVQSLQEDVKVLKEQLKSTATVLNSQTPKKLNIVYAVNCGGGVCIDSNGIYYAKDPLEAAAAHGQHWQKGTVIRRIPEQDQDLYHTIRHFAKIGYTIPMKRNGNYVLVLKFFSGDANLKVRVFDVVVNKLHTVIKDLDLYAKAGSPSAYDEYVEFSVLDGYFIFEGKQSIINDETFTLEFITKTGEPVISAIYVLQGNLEDVPKLPPIFYTTPAV